MYTYSYRYITGLINYNCQFQEHRQVSIFMINKDSDTVSPYVRQFWSRPSQANTATTLELLLFDLVKPCFSQTTHAKLTFQFVSSKTSKESIETHAKYYERFATRVRKNAKSNFPGSLTILW